MLVFSAVFWREINTQTNPEHHLFTTATHRTKSLKIKQKTTIFLSHKKSDVVLLAYKNCKFWNTQWTRDVSQCLRFAWETYGQTLCLTQDVLSDGTKQTWNKEKRCSVCTLLSWFRANEEQIPVDTTFGVNHACRDYVTEGTRTTEDIYSKHRSTETLVI